MTQLILNNTIVLPETSADKYRCYPAQLTQSIDMISGRRVVEVRGNVQMIEYAYDYMGNDLLRQILAVLRGQTELHRVVSFGRNRYAANRYIPDRSHHATGLCVFQSRTAVLAQFRLHASRGDAP